MGLQKVFFRFIVSFIAISLIFTGIFSNTALANDDQKTTLEDEKISNFEYITQTEDKLEYTFTENGIDYKIIEHLSPQEVVSHFYKKNAENNEFEKYDTVTTTVLEDEEAIQSHSESTDEVTKTDISAFEQEIQEPGVNVLSTGFKYERTNYGTSIPTKWAVGAIAITIASITKVPATAKWVINIANLTFQLGTGKLYYKYVYYKKGSGAATVTRVERTVYTNSKHTNALGASIHDYSRSGTKLVATYTYK